MASYPIAGLLNQYVIVTPFVSRVDGDATYGTPVTHACRIDYTIKRALNATGTEVTSTATVFIAALIGKEDKITFPDGTIKTPIGVNYGYDRAGVFGHSEVMV